MDLDLFEDLSKTFVSSISVTNRYKRDIDKLFMSEDIYSSLKKKCERNINKTYNRSTERPKQQDGDSPNRLNETIFGMIIGSQHRQNEYTQDIKESSLHF